MSWFSTGGILKSSPAVTVISDQGLMFAYLFAMDSDEVLSWFSYKGDDHTKAGWFVLGGTLRSASAVVGWPVQVRDPMAQMWVFILGIDQNVWCREYFGPLDRAMSEYGWGDWARPRRPPSRRLKSSTCSTATPTA